MNSSKINDCIQFTFRYQLENLRELLFEKKCISTGIKKSLDRYEYRRFKAQEMFFFGLKSGLIILLLYTKDFQIVGTASRTTCY